MNNLPPDLAKLKLSEDELALLGKLQRQADYMVQFAYRDQFVGALEQGSACREVTW